jgi:hypothetical protein
VALPASCFATLRRRAAGQLRRERRGQTLQPTALVHEAYLRLVDQRRVVWQNRGQFFGVACQMMRRILVDRARAHRMAKRSGQWARVTLRQEVTAMLAALGTTTRADTFEFVTMDALKSGEMMTKFGSSVTSGYASDSVSRGAGRNASLPTVTNTRPASTHNTPAIQNAS